MQNLKIMIHEVTFKIKTNTMFDCTFLKYSSLQLHCLKCRFTPFLALNIKRDSVVQFKGNTSFKVQIFTFHVEH